MAGGSESKDLMDFASLMSRRSLAKRKMPEVEGERSEIDGSQGLLMDLNMLFKGF